MNGFLNLHLIFHSITSLLLRSILCLIMSPMRLSSTATKRGRSEKATSWTCGDMYTPGKAPEAADTKDLVWKDHGDPLSAEINIDSETLQLEALEEALNCTKCTVDNIESALTADINSGAYNISEYPPYFPNNSKTDAEKISPLDTESTCRESSIWKIISPPQRQRYYELVEQYLNHELDNPVPVDADVAVMRAHYSVDAHIQRHYLDRRSMLQLCRDEEDLEDFREWRWIMVENCSIHYPDITPYPVGDSRVEWPNDGNGAVAHQERTWKQDGRAREVCVEKARAKWASIMAERRKERDSLLAKSRDVVTIRLYCGGELQNVRRLKMYPEAMLGLRMGRPTQSSGF